MSCTGAGAGPGIGVGGKGGGGVGGGAGQWHSLSPHCGQGFPSGPAQATYAYAAAQMSAAAP